MTEDAIQNGHDYILAQFDQLRNAVGLAEAAFASRNYKMANVHLGILAGFAMRTSKLCEQIDNLTKEKNNDNN